MTTHRQEDAPFRRLRLKECDEKECVTGTFFPSTFLSWHDDHQPVSDAVQVVEHEILHHVGIGGTFLHLGFLADYTNHLIGNAPSVTDKAIPDFVVFHEALPKALDLLWGSTLSAYREQKIIDIASVAADVVRRYREKTGLYTVLGADSSDFILKAIYQAISDTHYVNTLPSQGDISITPYSGEEALALIADVVKREPASRLLPPDFKPHKGIVHQIKEALGNCLDAAGSKTSANDLQMRVFYVFYLLALLACRAKVHPKDIGDVLPSIISFLFPNAAHALHLSLNSLKKVAHLSTVLHTRNRAAERLGITRLMPSDINEGRGDYSDYGNNVLAYVYSGFLFNVVLEPVKAGFEYAHLMRVLSAFPGTLITLFDLLVMPAHPDKQHENAVEIMSVQPCFSELYKDCFDVRRQIWAEILRCLPHVHFFATSAIFREINELSGDALLRHDLSLPGTIVHIGDRPFLRVREENERGDEYSTEGE